MNAWMLFKRLVDGVGLGGPARRVWRLLRNETRALSPRPAAAREDALYEARVAAEKANYRDVTNVHELPPIFHYWSNKYLAPKFLPFGFGHPEEFFANEFLRCWEHSDTPKRFVSIGAGNCDAEVGIAKRLVNAGHRDFTIECVDINDAMLRRGLENAVNGGVEGLVAAVEGDFNKWTPTKSYDCVMANQSLHHVLELEHLFESISRAIGPAGHFVIYDMIGRNGHMRWPEALEIVQKFWAELTPQQRYNRLLQRQENKFVNWDCSVSGFEGIRAQDILPLAMERFAFELFLGFSNLVDPFVDRAFGHNFDADSPADLAFIDKVEAEDERLIRSGSLKPTHMFAVLRNGPAIQAVRCIDHLTPEFCVRNPTA